MTANALDARVLADLAAETLAHVNALREGLVTLSTELQRLPGFIRSYVERELSQATDYTLPEWSGLFDDLSIRVEALQAGALQLATGATVANPGAARAGDYPDLVESLNALSTFLAKAPGKMSAVPALLMGQRERAEFTANLDGQVTRLHAVAAALPRLAADAAHLALS